MNNTQIVTNSSIDFNELNRAVHGALRAWRELNVEAENLLGSLILVQEQQSKMQDSSPTVLRLATNQILQANIDELANHDAQASRILQWRFSDDETLLAVASKLGLSEDQIKRHQRKAIEQLTHIILENEKAIRNELALTLESHLFPSTYSSLFGVDNVAAQVVETSLSNDSPWVLCLTGIGGIGKTAVADKVARQLIQTFQFEDIIWIRLNPDGQSDSDTAQMWQMLMSHLAERVCPHLPKTTSAQERERHVRQMLKTLPYYIVIDNIESQSEISYFLTQLNDLSEPSKFLVTSRIKSKEQSGVTNFTLSELSLEDVQALIAHHAHDIGHHELSQISLDDAKKIYAVTGGNPLAIKLVVGLAIIRPLPQILDDLITIQSNEIESLYRYIYWQSWHALHADSQTLLQIMPMAGETGMAAEQMLAISGLSTNALWAAVNQLVYLSLLEVRGTVWEKRYGIHRLTYSFLRTEIINWPEDAP
ncbi:MAG: NB-ARC domain-containing protein [Chloroflexota bacterium]